MKKATLILGALALVLGLSQCRKPNAPAINGGNGTQHVVLQASFDNGGSKIAENGNGGLKWAEDDQIAVKQGGTSLGILNCTNAESGIFEGTITSTSGNITFTFGTQKFDEQTGTLDGAISLSSGEEAYNPEGSYTNVAMTMPHAVLKLDLSAFGTATPGTTVTISAGGSVVASVTGVTNADDNPYYVAMPAAASREYTFSVGVKTGKATWELAANTFYTKSGSSTGEAIVVAPTPKFSVSATKTVEFSKGNLYWDGSAWKFEANQWDFANAWNTNHVSHFFWSKSYDEAVKEGFDWGQERSTSDVFFTNTSETEGTFTVDGVPGWRTLTIDEWRNLLGISGAPSPRDNAASLRKFVTLTVSGKGEVKGLVILPDGDAPSPAIPDQIDEAYLTSNNAVFLPAAGDRLGTDVGNVGSYGSYWSSTPFGGDGDNAYYMLFYSGYVNTGCNARSTGYAVRLVRSGS